jgi:type II secretory ATPase GspE/PulE/Tfp pilus assembly ATPase PilB-like protein
MLVAEDSSIFTVLGALAFLALFLCFMNWLAKRTQRQPQRPYAPTMMAVAAESASDYNPGGPLTDRQAHNFFEIVLQAAIRQKADTILIDALSGRGKVRLRVDGRFEELSGVGDAESYRRLVAQAQRCAGLSAQPGSFPGGRGSFIRLYRKGHLRNIGYRVQAREMAFTLREVSRRSRAVRFDLESIPTPGSEALKISLRTERPLESTRFNLGFTAAAEQKYIEAVHARSGIVLLTGPCNAGKSTATYRALELLRDEGRKIITLEWPIEWMLKGTMQYWIRGHKDWRDFDCRLDKCLRRAIRLRPDVLLLQNIDWIGDRQVQLALDYAATGGLLITAVHIHDCAYALAWVLQRYFWNRRQEGADLFKAVVAPRRLPMVCMHCAEEQRVPASILVGAGMAEPPLEADGHVATWRGRGCPLCANTGQLGSMAVYEVLDLRGKMKRFIDNENDWDWRQVDYLRRQAWLHGMRTQRELALERVLAGDISLQEALLSTPKPEWLTQVQAERQGPMTKKGS